MRKSKKTCITDSPVNYHTLSYFWPSSHAIIFSSIRIFRHFHHTMSLNAAAPAIVVRSSKAAKRDFPAPLKASHSRFSLSSSNTEGGLSGEGPRPPRPSGEARTTRRRRRTGRSRRRTPPRRRRRTGRRRATRSGRRGRGRRGRKRPLATGGATSPPSCDSNEL